VASGQGTRGHKSWKLGEQQKLGGEKQGEEISTLLSAIPKGGKDGDLLRK